MLFYCILLSLSTFCISSDMGGGPYAHIYSQVFDYFDKDGDNVVTGWEIWNTVPMTNYNDNTITKDEFMKAWAIFTRDNPEEEEKKKQSGELLFLKYTNTTISVNEILKLYRALDTNNDAVVSKEEFLIQVERISPEPHPTLPTTP